MRIRFYALLVALALAACRESQAVAPRPAGTPGVHVQGNQLVDSSGRPVRVRGVNRSGAEYACAQGWGIFDGPSDSASVQAIASWNAHVVRLPLNETCSLAINGVAPAYSGANYRPPTAADVALLKPPRLVVLLQLPGPAH